MIFRRLSASFRKYGYERWPASLQTLSDSNPTCNRSGQVAPAGTRLLPQIHSQWDLLTRNGRGDARRYHINSNFVQNGRGSEKDSEPRSRASVGTEEIATNR